MGKSKKSSAKKSKSSEAAATVGAESGNADAEAAEFAATAPKRPGSAVSQQFLPKKQQNAGSDWRKHQQTVANAGGGDIEQQNSTYGYVPFKSAPLPIYGIRANGTKNSGKLNNNNNVNNIIQNNNSNNRAPYTNSTYAPPYALRADSAMSTRTMTGGGGGIALDSRAGSELGLYKSSSRYQSYTTLPRPEQVDYNVEEIRHPSYANYYHQPQHHHHHQQQQQRTQPIYGMFPATANSGVDIYDTNTAATIYDGLKSSKFVPKSSGSSAVRPPSASALYGSGGTPLYNNNGGYGNAAFTIGALPPQLPASGNTVFGDSATAHVADEIMRTGLKPIVNWGILSLSSYLQIVFGSGLVGISVARFFLRFENAKCYELLYGMSVLLAGVIALFSARQRSYALAIAAFVHSVVNALFFFVPLYTGILPLLSGTVGLPSTQHKTAVVAATIDSFEMNMAVSVLSILELMTALVALAYGCKALGATVCHVECIRLQLRYVNAEALPYAGEALSYAGRAPSFAYRNALPTQQSQQLPYRSESALTPKKPL